jgi:general secretion pathway protein A
MYETYYGLTAKPFQLNPDPEFFFASAQHRRAMAFVEYGLHQSEGFIVITGEVGAGKTTIVRNLLANLDPTKVLAAHLVSTQLDAEDTLRMVAAAFGVRVTDQSKSDLLLTLEAFLASQTALGKRCLLVVDEAQNLTARAVEELRMLSNFQLGTHALLQSFLVGQPEFRHILQSPQMHQLRQRVIAACHIAPLDADDTRRYVTHRLTHAGWKGSPSIEAGAFQAVHQASGGVPRRINLIFDRILLSCFLADRHVVTAQIASEVAGEIEGETSLPPETRAPRSIVKRAERPAAERDAAETSAVQIEHIEAALQELETALSRIERGNHAMLAFFRRFVDWVQTRERRRGDLQ